MLRRIRRPQLALIALLIAVILGYSIKAIRTDGNSSPSNSSSATGTASASAASGSASGSAPVALSSLPAQVAQTVHLIQHGGPYPYSQDGVVFDNNERLLPIQKRGYYHEYTVPTPGADTRATRRIVTGSDGAYYYTGDHYESFQRVELDKVSAHVIQPARTKRETIQAIYDALDAPKWAAPNLDALADVLRDLSWRKEGPVQLEWRVSRELPIADLNAIHDVLATAVAESESSAHPLALSVVI